jgi:general stress protein 26
VKQRDQVQMTAAQAAEFLAAGHKVQFATNGPDGFPHLVTMYYALIDGRITFWTYRRSQKARNLERDPRISCLVETGEQYFDLRGVLVQGTARRIDDPAAIKEVGRQIAQILAAPPTASPDASPGLPESPAAPPADSPRPTESPAAPPADSPRPTESPAAPPADSPRPSDSLATPPGVGAPTPTDSLTEYVERAARKRYAYTVEPSRLISWDHTRLLES